MPGGQKKKIANRSAASSNGRRDATDLAADQLRHRRGPDCTPGDSATIHLQHSMQQALRSAKRLSIAGTAGALAVSAADRVMVSGEGCAIAVAWAARLGDC